MASPARDMDMESDLSDISNHSGSRPATPGLAVTPRTSPLHSSLIAVAAQSTSQESSNMPHRAYNSNLDEKSSTAPALTRRRSSARLQESNSVQPSGNSTVQVENESITEARGSGTRPNAKSRRDSSKNWAYVDAPSRNIFANEHVEGKRARKQTERFGQQQQQQHEQQQQVAAEHLQDQEQEREQEQAQVQPRKSARRGSVTKGKSIEADESILKEQDDKDAEDTQDEMQAVKRRTLKIKVGPRSKRKSESNEGQTIETKKPETDEDPDEGVIRSSKRRRHGVHAIENAEEDRDAVDRPSRDQDQAHVDIRTDISLNKSQDEEEDENMNAIKARSYTHSRAKRAAKRRRQSSGLKVAGGDLSDEYEEKEDWSAEEDQAIPTSDEEDSEEDERRASSKRQRGSLGQKRHVEPKKASEQNSAKSASRLSLKSSKASRPSLSGSGTKKNNKDIIPARDLAAEAMSSQRQGDTSNRLAENRASPAAASTNRAPQTSAISAAATPPRPPAPKVPTRKPQGSNVLSSLLGFGAPSSRDGTPVRTNVQRPRPSAGATTGSPSVRPMGSQQQSSSSTTPSRASGDALNRASVASNIQQPGSRHSTQARANNPGLEGKHVTAEQMAERRERELRANANPKGLFDLLEGAELMMAFEDETRQRLASDPLLHKYKLYRPGRTEGMWKLVERIKEKEAKRKAQA